jgi:hypothetical protein
VAVTESEGDYARLTYRVPAPFTVMLHRVCPSAPDRLDAIILAIHPVDELLCGAQPIMYLVDPEIPTSADAASMAYRRWLRENGLRYGTIWDAVPQGALR